jgi:hypothetical protein
MEEHDTAQPPIEVVGLAEIASMLGVSKQRAQEIARTDGLFPPPFVRERGSGAMYYLPSMIEAFDSHRKSERGRPVKLQEQVVDELAHIPKDRQEPAQQILRMIYNIVRLHDLKVDRTGSRHQSLFLAIRQTEETSGVADFKPRFDREFFQPEPPDEQYRTLHASCGVGHETHLWEAA